MNEKRFWKIVSTVDWGSDFDYERIRLWMLDNLTLKEVKEFRRIASKKWDLLDKLVGNRNPSNGGDDSYSDLLYHVIGLGKKVYEANLEDYMLLAKRGDAPYGSSDGYKESFSYAIPYEDDFEKHNDPDHYPTWAKQARTEIDGLIKMDKKDDLKPVLDDFKFVRKNLNKVIKGNMRGFMSYEPDIVASLERIDKFFNDNYMDLPRKFTDNDFNGYNIHFVKNLLLDLIKRYGMETA